MASLSPRAPAHGEATAWGTEERDHRGDEGITFGGSPCLSELSHGCHGGGVRASNPQGQRFGNSVGPCRCGWDSTSPQQEGAFSLSSPGTLCGFFALQPQGHQICHFSCPGQAWEPQAHASSPHLWRPPPTPGPWDVCAHFKYLLKQLCPQGCLLPAVCQSVYL